VVDMTKPLHRLRQFAIQHKDAAEGTTLSADNLRVHASDVDEALQGLDSLWEAIAGRKLTDEEKGIV
jgi:hypothetical protein